MQLTAASPMMELRVGGAPSIDLRGSYAVELFTESVMSRPLAAKFRRLEEISVETRRWGLIPLLSGSRGGVRKEILG